MELPEPRDPDTRLRQMARYYSEIVRVGAVFLGWTLIAFVAGCAAFLVAKVTWKFLISILQALGEI